MERLEQERKIQELEELRRKVKAILIDRWSCFIQVFTICKTDIHCCFDQAEEEARRRKEEEEERLRQEEEQRQAVLVKAREIEEARRLEEEARRKAEEEARRKVPWVLDIAYLSRNAVQRFFFGGGERGVVTCHVLS